MIEIDGTSGGGQLLRTSLSLSLITGQPFRMRNIRGKRSKPGLMRQHLTCVLAAQQISGAQAEGAEIGSRELLFTPGPIRAGDYSFAIGTGGSTTLVLQTLLPALLHATEATRLTITGGTHNPLAPPFEFIRDCYLPALHSMGVRATVSLERPGFAQSGGGILKAEIQPLKKWKALKLTERGVATGQQGEILHAHLPLNIAERELKAAMKSLGWAAEAFTIRDAPESEGPGNILMLRASFEQVVEITSAVAQMGRSAESLGHSAAKSLLRYLATEAPVGVHLADQLLLPLALAGQGCFTTFALSEHFHSNLALIPQFSQTKFQVEAGAQGCQTVSVVEK